MAYHKGRYRNPLSDAEVGEKFRALAGEHMTDRRTDALLDQLWRLDELPHLSQLIRLLRI